MPSYATLISFHLTVIHAVTLWTRTRSVIGGVHPFYIWHSAPAMVLYLIFWSNNFAAIIWQQQFCNNYVFFEEEKITFGLEAVEGCCSCTVGIHQLFFQNHIAANKKKLYSTVFLFLISSWIQEKIPNFEDFSHFVPLPIYWSDLTLRKALNLLISGLQLPDPPCRKWIKVDFGSEGRGLQREMNITSQHCENLFLGVFNMWFCILTWRTDLV